MTFAVADADREVVAAELAPSRAAFLHDLAPDERAAALRRARVVLTWVWEREIRPEEDALLADVELVQLLSAGADAVPFGRLPSGATVAGNVGAYAETMAEHVLAMTLALAKRLRIRHEEMARGEFNTYVPNLMLRGGVCGVLGFGGIGRASAGLLAALGMRIHAVNTSGRTEEPVEVCTTLDGLDAVLEAADVLVISLPLTVRTRELIGARELAIMKPEAILVNVARGEIVDEDALYEHLAAHPGFSAGLDVWWQEPDGRSGFLVRRPFFELANVLGSPHNSAIVPGVLREAARRAAANAARHLRGEPVRGVVDPRDYGPGP